MMQINNGNFIMLMRLWENAFLQKPVFQKSLVKMHSALPGCKKKKNVYCTLTQLWENALARKLLSQKAA
jgi:hypothetical protein